VVVMVVVRLFGYNRPLTRRSSGALASSRTSVSDAAKEIKHVASEAARDVKEVAGAFKACVQSVSPKRGSTQRGLAKPLFVITVCCSCDIVCSLYMHVFVCVYTYIYIVCLCVFKFNSYHGMYTMYTLQGSWGQCKVYAVCVPSDGLFQTHHVHNTFYEKTHNVTKSVLDTPHLGYVDLGHSACRNSIGGEGVGVRLHFLLGGAS
jgi:hypothetical protein